MKRRRYIDNWLIAVLFSATALGCSTQAADDSANPITEELTEMGFDEVGAIPPEDTPVGTSAVGHIHPDGRTALVISDESGAELDGMVFDPSGTLVDRLSAGADEVPYAWWCTSVAWYSCYGGCAPACWSDAGFGQGCHTDCSQACDWYAAAVCPPEA